MTESIQHWLDRNRPPRVHITYDVEIGDAIVMKELPFIVGILADLTPHETERDSLVDRKFVEIDRDNFPKVMRDMAPSASVPLTAPEGLDGVPETVELTFETMDDFRPEKLVDQLGEQIESLQTLLDERANLAELMSRADVRNDLSVALQKMLPAANEESGE